MNKNLFKTSSSSSVAIADTVNEAGGLAYSMSDEHALAQLVVTGCFNSTFYASSTDQLDKIKSLAEKCSSQFLAQCAVYGHEVAKMKDTPAYLLAVLCARGELDLVSKCFNRIITNSKMLANFVQVIRSGVTGRKSFGTAIKNLISNWITSKSSDQLFNSSIGLSQPSFSDIIKMVHPKPSSMAQSNMIGYLLGKEHDIRQLPERIRNFELLKKGESEDIPNVDFRCLSNLTLSDEQWKSLALNMSWNTLRMNINTLSRHNVFSCQKTTRLLADKLSNENEVKKNNAFPYQLLTTYQNTTDCPSEISNALQQAMETATANVSAIGDGNVAILVDISGSMSSPVTGYSSASSKTQCYDVAAMMASTILRQNQNGVVIPFHTQVELVSLNPFDSIITNSNKIKALPNGGTDCSCAMRYMNSIKSNSSTVIMISDNMSWSQYYGIYSKATGLANEWSIYKRRVKNAKLVLIDIQPYTSTQIQEQKDVLCVGGFNDAVFSVINNFANGSKQTFVEVINNYA